jgi:hypothetical protein
VESYHVCDRPGQISVHRPFYPNGAYEGRRKEDLFRGHGVSHRSLCCAGLPLAGRLKNGMKAQRMRFGLYSLNLTNHSNPLEVYNNVTSPYFGHFVGFQHRVNGFVVDIVD